MTYEFEENGKLVSGQWYRDSKGIKYYEGPSYLRGGKSVMTWYEIDGNRYCFDKQGYVAVGTRPVKDDDANPEHYTWYVFDENGACQGKYLHNGLAWWNDNVYYLEDGVSVSHMKLVDGDYYYFYWYNYRAGIKDQRFHCVYNDGLLPVGDYYFGSDGKMLNQKVYSVDGTLYYFEMGKETQGTGTVIFQDVECAIDETGKVDFTGFITDALGRKLYYEHGVTTEWVKNGLIHDEDGEIRFYVDGVPTRAGLVRDENGNYYYINSTLKAVKNCTYAFSTAMANGLMPGGTHHFDENGIMTDPPVQP